MFILNISVLTFLIGLGLFSYSIYDRSVNLVKEEPDESVKNLSQTNDLNIEVISNNDEKLPDLKKSLQSELSKKKLEIQDEKDALTKYGSSASGASLGDILGSVLKK